MTITERVAYLKGLAEGLNLDKESNEGKLFHAVIEALDDIALELADATDRLDVLDQDLADVEDVIFDYDDDDDDDFKYYGFDYDDDEDDDDEGVYEFECPHCHETVFFDESIFDDDDDFELECPACGAKLDAVFEDDDDDDEADAPANEDEKE